MFGKSSRNFVFKTSFFTLFYLLIKPTDLNLLKENMGKKKGTLTSSEGGGSPSYEENEAVANSANATIQDVLAAIRTLSENVDKRFIELNTTITSLKADVSDIRQSDHCGRSHCLSRETY